jgi:ferredoxin-like protein FixX
MLIFNTLTCRWVRYDGKVGKHIRSTQGYHISPVAKKNYSLYITTTSDENKKLVLRKKTKKCPGSIFHLSDGESILLHRNKCLDTWKAPKAAKKSEIVALTCNDRVKKKIKAIKMDSASGIYFIETDSGLRLDIHHPEKPELTYWTPNANKNQQWMFQPVDYLMTLSFHRIPNDKRPMCIFSVPTSVIQQCPHMKQHQVFYESTGSNNDEQKGTWFPIGGNANSTVWMFEFFESKKSVWYWRLCATNKHFDNDGTKLFLSFFAFWFQVRQSCILGGPGWKSRPELSTFVQHHGWDEDTNSFTPDRISCININKPKATEYTKPKDMENVSNENAFFREFGVWMNEDDLGTLEDEIANTRTKSWQKLKKEEQKNYEEFWRKNGVYVGW